MTDSKSKICPPNKRERRLSIEETFTLFNIQQKLSEIHDANEILNDLKADFHNAFQKSKEIQLEDIKQCKKKISRTFNKMHQSLTNKENELNSMMDKMEHQLLSSKNIKHENGNESNIEISVESKKSTDYDENIERFDIKFDLNSALIAKQNNFLEKQFAKWTEIMAGPKSKNKNRNKINDEIMDDTNENTIISDSESFSNTYEKFVLLLLSFQH